MTTALQHSQVEEWRRLTSSWPAGASRTFFSAGGSPKDQSEHIYIRVDDFDGGLTWDVRFTEPGCCSTPHGWDAFEPIRFFFFSISPPKELNAYNLLGDHSWRL